ncbi:MAG: PP2C family protein-serine/threonine phosphatase [Cyanobacteria bacterium P01_H01_bin.121]
MTTVPLPNSPQSSTPVRTFATGEATPVVALKEIVAQLNREQTKIQDLLSSLGFALRSFTNLNHFLELIPLIASRVTEADGGALVVFKPNGQIRLERLHCSHASYCDDIRDVLENAINQVATVPSGLMSRSGLMAALDDRIAHQLSSDIQMFGTAILIRNVERGRLYVFSYHQGYSWTEARQKLVRLVADQTAVALENDELTAELRKKERLDRELEIGAEIQRQLLPRHCPKVDGLELAARCQTANRVGGDYYDFIPIRRSQSAPEQNEAMSERWGITIGDVMGKGVPAGLIMTMLRGMLRAEVLNGHSPARILEHLNQVMHTDLENSNRFVTLFYSEYDPQTRMLSFSNAAHNPPLLWQRSLNTVYRLDAMGMLIGLDANSQYEGARVQLQPGDIVIYYTDGFTDAPGEQGGRFDEEKLIKIIKLACEYYDQPQAILDFLFEQIQRFMGRGKRNDDDMTLVVLKVQDHKPA